MFTGLVEHVGTLDSVTPATGSGLTLAVDLGPLAEGARLGDSICVSGSCLTITQLSGSVAHFDVSGETRSRTTMAGWKAGRRLNLERALRLGDRLGGHLVGGHIDGVGRLQERRPQGDSVLLVFQLPEDGSVRVVEKGSVAIDGVSLTCWDCVARRFSVAVIPHTLAQTTLQQLRPGEPVNLEQDVVGRWVESLLAH